MRSSRSVSTSLIASCSSFFSPRLYRALCALLAGAAFGLPAAASGAVIAAFGQKLESQGTGDRRGLDQAYGDLVAQAVGLAAAVADQRVLVLVIAEVVIANRARGNEPVRA